MHEAIKWYTLAAEAGFARAQYNLGNCYFRGAGVSVNKREAVKWLPLAVKGGDINAQALLDDSF
jgi:TPR repeat protein